MNEPQTALFDDVSSARRRYRWRDAIHAASRIAWLGPLAAVAILIVARLRPVSAEVELALALLALPAMFAALRAGARRWSAIDIARRLDRELGLRDLIGTAVALATSTKTGADVDETIFAESGSADGKIGDAASTTHAATADLATADVGTTDLTTADAATPSDETIASRRRALVDRQLEEALAVISTLTPRRAIPLSADRQRLALAGVLALAVAALLVAPNPRRDEVNVQRAVRDAALVQAEAVEEIREQLPEEEALSDEDRAALDAALKRLGEALREGRGRPEDALAAAAEAEMSIAPLRDPAAAARADASARLAERMSALSVPASSGPSGGAGDGTTSGGGAALDPDVAGDAGETGGAEAEDADPDVAGDSGEAGEAGSENADPDVAGAAESGAGDGTAASSDVEAAARALEELASQVESMDAAERAALADTLQAAAADARGAVPGAADALQDLSAAAGAGDAAGARSAADRVADAMRAAAQGGARDAAVSQALGAAADARAAVSRAAAGAAGGGAVASTSGGGQSGSSGSSGSEGSAGSGGSGEQGGGSGGQSGASGQSGSTGAGEGGQGGEGSAGGQGEGQGQGAGAGQGQGQGGVQGAGQGQGAGSGQGAGQGSGSGQGGGQGSGSGQGEGSGAGSGSGADGSGAGGGGGSGGGFGRGGEGSGGQPVPSGLGREWSWTGAPQDGVVGSAGAVYAPPAGVASSGESSFVPARPGATDSGGLARRRETVGDGALGPSMIPYEQVFSRYRDAAGAAQARRGIPPGMREYVRQYFEQLEPR